MKNIKSSFFIQNVFALLRDEIKLKIAKYNKYIQSLIDVNIMNYKFLSGKYVIYEKNGKAKEYNGYNDNLIYEGGYLKGKRHGKGKEYNSNNCLIYEGNYSDGEKDGLGIEYFSNGKIKFKGDYFKGKKWNGKLYNNFNDEIYTINYGKGYVKEFIEEKNIIFEGEYLNGEKYGKGKEYDINNKLMFEGEYLNGEKHGKGEEYSYDGNLNFEGEYKKGKKWDGYFTNKQDIYNIKNGNGYIIEYNDYVKNLIFEVEYANGEKNGKGKKYDYDGKIKFEGEYLNDYKAKGIEYGFENNLYRFEGEYYFGYKKKGREYAKDKLEYEGEYLFNKKWNGKGYDEEGNVSYEIINGNGYVKEYTIYI